MFVDKMASMGSGKSITIHCLLHSVEVNGERSTDNSFQSKALVDYLVARGVDPSRLVANGYGRTEIGFGNATDRTTTQTRGVVTLWPLETL